MSKKLQRLSLVAMLVGLLTAPAHATDAGEVRDDDVRLPIDSNVQLSLELVEGRGGVYAIVTVEASWGLLIEGEVQVYAEGNYFALGTVSTDSVQHLMMPIAEKGTSLAACARFEGAFHVSGDVWREAEREVCDYHDALSLEIAPRLELERRPRLPAPEAPRSSLDARGLPGPSAD